MNRVLSFSTYKAGALNPTISPVQSSLEMKKWREWHGFAQRPNFQSRVNVCATNGQKVEQENEIKGITFRIKNRWYRMYKKRARFNNIAEKIGKWVEKTVISARLSQTTAKQILNRLKETYELLRKKPEEQAQKSGKYGYSH